MARPQLPLLGIMLLVGACVPTAEAVDPGTLPPGLVSVIVCAMLGLDYTADQVLGFVWQDTGHDVVGLAIFELGPGGTVGAPVNAAGRALGSLWWATYGTAIADGSNAWDSLDQTLSYALSHAGDTVHAIKCFLTQAFSNTWYGTVAPTITYVDDTANAEVQRAYGCLGGPLFSYVFDAIPPPGQLPHVPSPLIPAC